MSGTSAPPPSALVRLREGLARQQMGDLEAAERIYNDILAADPRNADALNLLGAIAHQRGHNDRAAELMAQACALQPANADMAFNLGTVRNTQRRWDDAEVCFRAAIALRPDFAGAHCNLGVALTWQGRTAEAEAALRASLARAPTAAAWSALGVVLQHQARDADAEAAWEKAVALEPRLAEAHFNLSALRLSRRDFARGWAGFAWREAADPASFGAVPRRPPRWSGEDLAGKTILVWGEQGLGEQVLFAGLIPDLLAGDADVVLECEPRLVPLLARSFPSITVVPRGVPPHPATQSPRIAFHAPLGDFGSSLRPNRERFPVHGGYLKADPARVKGIRDRYHVLAAGKPLVGISWQSARVVFGAAKSTDLARHWGRVLNVPGVQFVSLQYGPAAADAPAAESTYGISLHRDLTVDPMDDIDGLAAQIAALDLVISVSNTTVHLAGALGVPVWTLAPKGAGRLWYWFQGVAAEGANAWYPSMRVLSQPQPGAWPELLAQAGTRLQAWVQGKGVVPT